MEVRSRELLSRPLVRPKRDVSLSSFSFLFSEIVRYGLRRSRSTADLEKGLSKTGYLVGVRLLELLTIREKGGKRETKLIGILQFIHGTLWKYLFGKNADGIEKSTENEDEYMIADRMPLVNRFVSVPRDMPHLNCAAYVAGIIQGVLDGSGFPAQVSAHTVDTPGTGKRTIFLMKFESSVIARESK
eukprot:TRINITY_DN1223_c0_g1_i2.p1 TRINITY_DN1223_c0_g1~~TRINITY_DN1223_c0_g1_i2.p1  ORF type:complete len:187 (+),score=51.26 TRINITY_DN1223_c0_g1_i2:108-668(+)